MTAEKTRPRDPQYLRRIFLTAPRLDQGLFILMPLMHQQRRPVVADHPLGHLWAQHRIGIRQHLKNIPLPNHQGPYENIGRSYAKVLSYLNEYGYDAYTSSREVYAKGPGMLSEDNPNNYLTEIQLPIETVHA